MLLEARKLSIDIKKWNYVPKHQILLSGILSTIQLVSFGATTSVSFGRFYQLIVYMNIFAKNIGKNYQAMKRIWLICSKVCFALFLAAFFVGSLLATFIESYIGVKLMFIRIILFTLGITYDVVYYKEWSIPRRIVNATLFFGGISIIVFVFWLYS